MLELEQEIETVQAEVNTLQERNKALNAEDMIKKDEIYYQVIDSESDVSIEDGPGE